MATSGPRHTVLLFCKFLAHRVRTENLDVLYHATIEFMEDPPCFTRVDEMVYRVFPMVAILPTELSDPPTRAKADRLLQRMREDWDSDEEGELYRENELRALRLGLQDRVVLKNWDQLEQMYSEFKNGIDRTLRAFVALQPEAIVVLPVSPTAQQTDTTLSSCTTEVPLNAPASSYLEADEAPMPYRRFLKNTPADVLEIAHVIRLELDAIEATEPWHRIFRVSEIVYPFDEKQHPKVALKFKTFWRHYARAVWQRRFWCRLPSGEREDEYKMLREQGRNAVSAYNRSVFIPLYGAFGAQFFVDLDAQTTRHYWWWYREPLVDLVLMASVVGIEYTLRYMKTQAKKRFPTPHPQFQSRANLHDLQSTSMWGTTKAMKEIHDAVVKLKRRSEICETAASQTARTSRKRARSKHCEDSENEQ